MLIYTLTLDNEGLLPLKDLTYSSGRIFCGDQEVFVEPNVRFVFDYLIDNESLKNISKIRFFEHHTGIKRAPIYGVPFIEAFNKIKFFDNRKIQSSYQRTDWAEKAKFGVIGTLVAHIEKIEHCIKFECWELFNVDSDIFYVHGEIDLNDEVFTHLDGATIFYTKEEMDKLMYQKSISRGVKKDKLFRLDGKVSFAEGRNILNMFLPLEDLSCEYLEVPPNLEGQEKFLQKDKF